MRNLLIATGAAMLLALPVVGQCYTTDANPSTGGNNVIPFGMASATWANQRYQTKMTAADLGKAKRKISTLGFAPGGTGTHNSTSIIIRMAHHKGALTTNFLGNLRGDGGGTVVLAKKGHKWAMTASTWSNIGLTNAFNYDPAKGDLLLDITVTGNSTTGTGNAACKTGARPRLYAFNWTGSPPATGNMGTSSALKMRVCAAPPPSPDLPANITNYGTPCGFEYDGKDSVSGQTHNLVFQATKLPANAPVIFIFGLKRTSPVALPIGKCSLEASLLTSVNGKADARGTAGFKGSTSSTKGVRFYSQAVGLDSANKTLIASTGMSIDFTYTYDMGKEFANAALLFTGASDNKVLAGLSAVFKKPIDANLKAYQAGIQQAAGYMKQAAGAFAMGSAAEKAALLKNPTYLQMVGIFGTAVSEGLRTIAQLQVLLPGGPKNAQAVRDGLNDMSNALTAAGFSGQQLMGIYAQTTTLKPCGQLIGGMLMAAQAAAAKLTAWLP